MINRDTKYIEEIYNRFINGGILWFVERIDTNQFLYQPFDPSQNHQNPFVFDWISEISMLTLQKAYLSKEDIKQEFDNMRFSKGGCECCGNNSEPIPIKITEHEFVNSPKQ